MVKIIVIFTMFRLEPVDNIGKSFHLKTLDRDIIRVALLSDKL